MKARHPGGVLTGSTLRSGPRAFVVRRLPYPGDQLKDRDLCRLEHGVKAAEDRHGEDHVAVLAAYVQVAENVVRDAQM